MGIGMGLGAISGPAIKPLALARVLMLKMTGDVSTWGDLVDMLLVGPSAVGVHLAVYTRRVKVITDILEGLERFMESRGYASLEEFRGLVLRR